MKSIKIYQLIIATLLLPVFFSCKQWDEHVKLDDSRRGESIMQILSSNSEASAFVEILKKTGYDNLLSGDKMLTVFVPTNSALQSVNINDQEALLTFLKNHIAYLSYPVSSTGFKVATIEMLNGKYLKTDGLKIEGHNLLSTPGFNIQASNGVVHYVDGLISTKKNIWEYLSDQSSYAQSVFIKSLDKKEMDMDRSVQVGISADGRPLYDTIWINSNPLLTECPINDESQNYTFILLEPTVLNAIEAKYAKYFERPSEAQRDSIVRAELIKDCFLQPVTITAPGRYPSINDVLVDVDPTFIVETYEASNGIIYKVSNADVKIYENKLKTIIVEAENFFTTYTNGDAWSKRSRAWASGGQDMMLNGRSNHTVNYSYYDEVGDSIVHSSVTFSYHCFSDQATNLSGASGYLSQTTNCFIEYKQKLNSVGYKMYWSAYDDVAWHFNGSWRGGSDYWEPAKFSQKLLVSFPDQPALNRNSDGQFEHNFSDTTVFSSVRFTAGQQQELQLYRHRTSTLTANTGFFILSKNAASTSNADYYNFYEDEDQFGTKEILKLPHYGETTFIVANSPDNKSTYSGMIFLDYIKLVPDVDVNE